MALGAEPEAMKWYRQAELQHARWAMLGAAGVLVQSVAVPDVFWYDAALHLPESLGPVNLGSLLAVQFLLMHFVEVRRWVDLKNPGAASQDPIFTNNKLPKGEVGYPGGIFDPMNLASPENKEKELKNGRCVQLLRVALSAVPLTLLPQPRHGRLHGLRHHRPGHRQGPHPEPDGAHVQPLRPQLDHQHRPLRAARLRQHRRRHRSAPGQPVAVPRPLDGSS